MFVSNPNVERSGLRFDNRTRKDHGVPVSVSNSTNDMGFCFTGSTVNPINGMGHARRRFFRCAASLAKVRRDLIENKIVHLFAMLPARRCIWVGDYAPPARPIPSPND